MNGGDANMEEAFDDDEDEEEVDGETKAKHEAFAAKRKGHYGNEAEALRVAKALAAEEDEAEDDGEEVGEVPAVPALPNGSR